jgi:hypothetical protein
MTLNFILGYRIFLHTSKGQVGLQQKFQTSTRTKTRGFNYRTFMQKLAVTNKHSY